jgi:peptide/nickel transport system permease protein
MTTYIAGRLVQAVIVIWLVATIVFAIVRVTPGDPAVAIGGENARAEDIARIRSELGLDDALVVQYVRFLGNAVTLDFGESLRFRGQSAMDLIVRNGENTLKLAIVAFAISVSGGILIGAAAAARPGGVADRLGRGFAIMGQSMPSFWVGLLLILLFAVKLGWLPTSGTGSWKHYVLPAATLGWLSMASVMRLTRSSMLDVLDSDFVRLLRIKGISERSVLFRHALRNAALPVLTLASLQLVAFVSGSVVVETIFTWPGLGRLLADAAFTRDYTVVQAGVFVVSAALVLTNLVVDVLYAYIDPRIRYY